MAHLVQLDLTGRAQTIFGAFNKENAMTTQRACLFLVSILLLAATSPVVTGLQAAQAGRQTVPEFRLQNVAGGYMTSEDLKGKVTVVDLWATWCGHCAEEVSIYNQLYDTFEGQDVAIVGIAVQSPHRDIPSKVRQLGIKYAILIGDDEALHAFGLAQGYPTTVVLNKEGEIYRHYTGTVPNKEERIKQDIQHLLAEDSR
jgi:thiol-disulfide isomerase/thioredoxin